MTRHRDLTVTPAALTRHARSLDAVAAAVERGLAAARQVRLGRAAYGQLCAAFPTMLDPLHDLADRTLREAGSTLEESARAVRSAAERYAATDDRAATRFGPLR